ncbi:hypothetical protein AB0G74_04500 [Streptomyces sp. NPDC020875]|uniref:hypothetical protein n=1 Tax=Streptomyces sp. NPDC020875 TaxID=3154898 RepID=UPI0033EFCF18
MSTRNRFGVFAGAAAIAATTLLTGTGTAQAEPLPAPPTGVTFSTMSDVNGLQVEARRNGVRLGWGKWRQNPVSLENLPGDTVISRNQRTDGIYVRTYLVDRAHSASTKGNDAEGYENHVSKNHTDEGARAWMKVCVGYISNGHETCSGQYAVTI